jgi:hypothetical protein
VLDKPVPIGMASGFGFWAGSGDSFGNRCLLSGQFSTDFAELLKGKRLEAVTALWPFRFGAACGCIVVRREGPIWWSPLSGLVRPVQTSCTWLRGRVSVNRPITAVEVSWEGDVAP